MIYKVFYQTKVKNGNMNWQNVRKNLCPSCNIQLLEDEGFLRCWNCLLTISNEKVEMIKKKYKNVRDEEDFEDFF